MTAIQKFIRERDMGAEFLSGMDDGSGAGFKVEYDAVRIIPGDIETVRIGLIHATEQLGYRLLDDNPLQARRKARGLGKSWGSNNILDYQSNLTINLKQKGANATRATFNYSIGFTLLYDGDKATLSREVDALIGLMSARTASANCTACGAYISAGTRFCRQCGAPSLGATPAEVEVYQMTALTNTSYKNLMGGFIFVLCAMILPLFLLFLGANPVKLAKAVKIIGIISGTMGLTGLAMLINALRISKRMIRLNEDDEEIPVFTRKISIAKNTASLPSHNEPVEIPSSVTEGTTDLLGNKIESQRADRNF